jgi:hypothetical protein
VEDGTGAELVKPGIFCRRAFDQLRISNYPDNVRALPCTALITNKLRGIRWFGRSVETLAVGFDAAAVQLACLIHQNRA